MLKKHTVFILIILTFLTLSLFAQNMTATNADKIDGIIQMKAATAKLKTDMTKDEVETLLGKPTFEFGYQYVYWFKGEERLTLVISDKLSYPRNKDDFNLLTDVYAVLPFDTSVFIDDKEFTISSPILEVGYSQQYLSAEDFEEIFDIKFSWDKEKTPAIIPQKNSRGRYTAFVVDFPVFMDDTELIISNPILYFGGTIYISLNDLDMKYNYNNEKKRSEITKDEPILGGFYREYPAIVTDVSVFIDGEKLLTFNPIVTINNKVYLPANEIRKEFKIKISQPKEEMNVLNGVISRHIIHNDLKTIEIFTQTEDNTISKNNEDIAKFKEAMSKLSKGMPKDENVLKILGEPYESPQDMLMSSIPPPRYKNKYGGVLTLSRRTNDMSSIFNSDGIDMFATGYIATTANIPTFVDGKEISILSPIVYMGNANIYVPIEDLAEYLKIKAEWNEEKTQLNITTTQEEK